MPRWRRGLPLLVALLVVVIGFLGLTRGLDAWHAGDERPTTGDPRLPTTVQVPSVTVPTTTDRGPVGPVGVVCAVRSVLEGFSGEVANPWVAISSLDGAYRAISHPDLPPAARGAAVQVAPDGLRMAWGGSEEVVIYDPVHNTAVTHPTEGRADVGSFSPDGSRLLVNDGTLTVLDIDSGQQSALADEVPRAATAGAAWTADGTEVSWVAYQRLRTAQADGSGTIDRPTTLPQTTMLAWSPTGQQFLALDRDGGTLRTWTRSGGRLRLDQRVPVTEGVYLERLVGYTQNDRVAVVGLTLSTGTLPQLMTLDLTSGRATAVTALPLPGTDDNWVDSSTVSFAADAIAGVPVAFEPPPRPWSDRAVLSALIVGVGFVLGLYLTRRKVARRLRLRRRR